MVCMLLVRKIVCNMFVAGGISQLTALAITLHQSTYSGFHSNTNPLKFQVSDTKIGSIYRSYESTISRTLRAGKTSLFLASSRIKLSVSVFLASGSVVRPYSSFWRML